MRIWNWESFQPVIGEREKDGGNRKNVMRMSWGGDYWENIFSIQLFLERRENSRNDRDKVKQH